jgi:hypothetical protein
MPVRPDKWIRSVKDNPSGKVVADKEGNRWEWDSNDDTGRLLRQLNNDELAIEKTDIRPVPSGRKRKTRPTEPATGKTKGSVLAGASDAGGGFNPYDNAGKPRR